jgi:hypothetical protein
MAVGTATRSSRRHRGRIEAGITVLRIGIVEHSVERAYVAIYGASPRKCGRGE